MSYPLLSKRARCACWILCLLGAPSAFGQTVLLQTSGTAPLDQVGRTLLALPDVDGDQRADWASGSPFRAATAGPLTGAVEIRSGATGAVILTIEGDTAGQRFGTSLGLADVDGDGFPDLLVGAPLFSGMAGVATGRVTAHALIGGATLLTVEGLSPADRFGDTVCGLQDLTGDSRDEFAVGAPLFDGAAGLDSGRVSVHSGATGAELAALEGQGGGDRFGASLCATGDMDLDFVTEIAVGAPHHDGPAGVDAGRVYLLSAFLAQRAISDGVAPGERLGASVAGPGDLDGDGIPDLLAGADGSTTIAGPNAGRVEAMGGPALDFLWSLAGTQAGARFGSRVAGLGDMDGDGLPEVAIAAPLRDGPFGFDSGRVSIHGVGGVELVAIDGTSPLEQLGFAIAGGIDANDDGRKDLLAAAPFAAGMGSSQGGRVDAIQLDPPPGRIVRAYHVGPDPVRVTTVDADGDGDRDIAVICSGDRTLHILWNGDHQANGPTLGSGVFDTLPPTVITLDATADLTAIAGGDLDGDGLAEFAVGRQDGTIQMVDGTGTTAAPAFAAQPSLIVADPRPTPGPVSGLALLGGGGTPAVAVALAGSAFVMGEARVLSDPLGTPTLSPVLASAMSMQGIEVSDLDGDGHEDILAVSASLGVGSGVHILLGPTFTPATGSPFNVTGVPVSVAVAALDLDNQRNDVIVASVGLGGGGTEVLRNFSSGSGFAATTSVAGMSAARKAVPWSPTQFQSGAAVLDGLGNLFLLSGWNGSGFASTDPFPVGQGIVDIGAAQLTAFDGQSACNGEELVALGRADAVVRVVRQGGPALTLPMPGTGCPAGASVARMVFTGQPVLGSSNFSIGLVGATPSVLAYLIVQIAPSPGILPTVVPLAGCGFINYVFDWLPVPVITDPQGFFVIPLPLPLEPSLNCQEFGLQWAIEDGGPLGGLTASDAYVVRIGEY